MAISEASNVGTDVMVETLAGVLSEAVTTPFGVDRLYQGEKCAALEASTACKGAAHTPLILGRFRLSLARCRYNALSSNGQKYLLPEVYTRSKQECSMFV